MNCSKFGVKGLVGEASFRGLGNAKVNDLGHRHAIVEGDENVRGFDVAMDDAFLMGVLNGLANLDEQFEAFPVWTVCSGRSSR